VVVIVFVVIAAGIPFVTFDFDLFLSFVGKRLCQRVDCCQENEMNFLGLCCIYKADIDVPHRHTTHHHCILSTPPLFTSFVGHFMTFTRPFHLIQTSMDNGSLCCAKQRCTTAPQHQKPLCHQYFTQYVKCTAHCGAIQWCCAS